jgi:hypothetical protein
LPYQRAFHIVLVSVFLMNVFVLIYFVVNHGLVNDFTEVPNLFAISINSPPNRLMNGACGGGPEGKQYSIKFGVECERDHLYITDKADGLYGAHGRSAWRESVLSFKDLVKRGKHGKREEMGKGDWQQLEAVDEGVELDHVHEPGRTEYTGTDLLRMQTFSPTTPGEDNEERSEVAKRFEKLAKKKTGL